MIRQPRGNLGRRDKRKDACGRCFPVRYSAGLGPIALDRAGTTLYAGTSDGALLWWQLDEDGNVAKQEVTPAFHDKRAITSLGLLLGDVSLAVGDAQGELTTWFFVHTGASTASRRSCG